MIAAANRDVVIGIRPMGSAVAGHLLESIWDLVVRALPGLIAQRDGAQTLGGDGGRTSSERTAVVEAATGYRIHVIKTLAHLMEVLRHVIGDPWARAP